MSGLRKIIVTVVTLLLETGAFLFVVLVGKNAGEGVLIAFYAAVVAALAVYTGANVISKFSPDKNEPPKP